MVCSKCLSSNAKPSTRSRGGGPRARNLPFACAHLSECSLATICERTDFGSNRQAMRLKFQARSSRRDPSSCIMTASIRLASLSRMLGGTKRVAILVDPVSIRLGTNGFLVSITTTSVAAVISAASTRLARSVRDPAIENQLGQILVSGRQFNRSPPCCHDLPPRSCESKARLQPEPNESRTNGRFHGIDVLD
jgi:hypothetical protein